MIEKTNEHQWDQLNPSEKKLQLYYPQVHLLDEFLKRGAISGSQYQKSFHDLTEKMEIKKLKEKVDRKSSI